MPLGVDIGPRHWSDAVGLPTGLLAGLNDRFGRVGLRAEGRDFVYKFDRYGFDKTQHDIARQGGLTLSF